jgi:hypothetical protein
MDAIERDAIRVEGLGLGIRLCIKNNRPSTLPDHIKTGIAWTVLTTEAVIVYACGTL